MTGYSLKRQPSDDSFVWEEVVIEKSGKEQQSDSEVYMLATVAAAKEAAGAPSMKESWREFRKLRGFPPLPGDEEKNLDIAQSDMWDFHIAQETRERLFKRKREILKGQTTL